MSVVRLTWKIRNFSLWLANENNNDTLRSPDFKIIEMLNSNTKCEFEIRSASRGSIIVCLHADSGSFKSKADSFFTIKLDGTTLLNTYDCEECGDSGYNGVQFPRPDLKSLKNIMVKDTLEIECQLISRLNTGTCIECIAYTDMQSKKYTFERPIVFSAGGAAFVDTVSSKFPKLVILVELTVENIFIKFVIEKPKFDYFLMYEINLDDSKGNTRHSFKDKKNIRENDSRPLRQLSCPIQNADTNCVDDLIMKVDIIFWDKQYDSYIDQITCSTVLPKSCYITRRIASAEHVCLQTKSRDFTIHCQDKQIPVHKCLLADSSPVFHAMLQRDMVEKTTSEVIVEDVDPVVMSKLIDFLYTRKIGEVRMDMARRLYSAADKYQLDELKHKCVEFLINGFTVENVVDILLLSDMHQDIYLMNATKDFVHNYSEQVFRSEEWKRFTDDHSKLACAVMIDCCLKFSEKLQTTGFGKWMDY